MISFRGYFVVGGVGVSSVTPLNAFDNALKDAGLANYNLVPVSSIIPKGATEREPMEFEEGSIVFLVVSSCSGSSNDQIVVGLGWFKDEGSMGIVVEHHRVNGDQEGLKLDMKSMLTEAAAIRGIPLGRIKYHIEVLKVPEDSFGCAVACLVLTE